MRIGFDAKRAFFNFSGLGNYSRNTIACLAKEYPDHDYHLYIPRRKLKIPEANLQIPEEVSGSFTFEFPDSFAGRKLSSFWRSYWLGRRLEKDGVDLYHGLSNEIPFDLPRQGVRSIVSIHDLIFLRHPGWYKPIDRKIYTKKAKHACAGADRIIAISEQSKNDIMEFLGTPGEKIEVVYQGCDPVFYSPAGESAKERIRKKYSLPSDYLLYVGTIEPRKNLMNIVEALHMGTSEVPLIVIGRPTPYIDEVKKFIADHSLKHIHFLENVPNQDLPGIYQMAQIFIYPSRFEGFGIPILEALASQTPVITSAGGVFPEAGGGSSAYIDPDNPVELSEAITRILGDSELQRSMKENGFSHALKFTGEAIAGNIMQVYEKAMK